MESVIGIDLGTTNSVAATVRNNRVEVIPDAYGNRLHPSVVAFVPTGEVLVGHAARNRRHIDPRNTVYSAKRLIGQSIRNPLVRLALSTLPYQIEEGPNEQGLIVVRGRRYTIPEISSYVLMHLKQCAEHHLGMPVSKAVITVPANFTDSQRQATKYAGELAGLKVLRILNEPTAAALAYGFGKALDARLAIFDLGGGTFDVTVLQIQDKIFEVLATGGDSFLGGDDFDKVLLDMLAGQLLERSLVDVRTNPEGLAKLRIASEQIKCRLSDDDACAGTVHDLGFGTDGRALALDFDLSRRTFEQLIDPYVDRSVQACHEVLNAAGVHPTELTDLILVGGATRTPLVRDKIQRYFGLEPKTRINPDETVAYGAALQAAALTASATDPSEVYSLLLDVCPRGLGIATAGGFNELIVDRNTPIPVERSRLFHTSRDFQAQVDIQVSQGESKKFAENERLGVLSLQGLPEAPRGQVGIEVTFIIDTNGILSVRARDPNTNLQQQATIQVVGSSTRQVDEASMPPLAAHHLPSAE